MGEFLVLLVFCGLSAGAIGRIKGGSFWLWFLVGFCLPLLGTLAALLHRFEDREPLRRCHECGAVVPLHDQVCMRCGVNLDFTDEVLRPAGTPWATKP